MTDQGSQGLLSPYLRLRRIQACLPHVGVGKVLDFGCGSGKLAKFIPPDRYVGLDIDRYSLSIAKKKFPNHKFFTIDGETIDKLKGQFSAIVALAVVEHLPDPVTLLDSLIKTLNPNEKTYLILTTPHPNSEWIHNFGARFGIFSSHANEEHEELMGKSQLVKLSKSLNMSIQVYDRFLFGLNQLVVMVKQESKGSGSTSTNPKYV